jgi:hypothetical protein
MGSGIRKALSLQGGVMLSSDEARALTDKSKEDLKKQCISDALDELDGLIRRAATAGYSNVSIDYEGYVLQAVIMELTRPGNRYTVVPRDNGKHTVTW